MKKLNFKKIYPYFVALAIFFAITLVYFSPLFFEGKDLAQGDVTSYLGWGDDVRKHYEKTGEYSFWSNAMFSGMPSNYAYPPKTNNIFAKMQSLFTGFLPINTAGAFFVYMLGFFVFMLAIGCNVWLSIIGAIVYALCSYNIIIIDAGHVSKALVMATIAPVIGGIILCYRKRYIAGVLITLIATGMNVFWNHQQISYYLILTIICLAVVYLIYAIREKTIKDYMKSSVILLLTAILAATPAADKLIPTMDFSKETMRGGAVLKTDKTGKSETSGLDMAYAYQWSYGKMETMTLLIPNLYGASSHYNIGNDSETYEALRPTGQGAQFCRYAPMYWGDQPFTSGPVYAGAIICFLFILGLLICKGPERWWMLAATFLAIIMSWGNNFLIFNEFIFKHLPLYNKFRTPSMSLVIVNFTMAALGMMAMKQIWEADDKRKYLKPIYISAGFTAGLCLFFLLFGGSIFSFRGTQDAQLPAWLTDSLIADRKAMLRSDALRSMVFILIAAAVMVAYLLTDKFKKSYMLIAVAALCFIDLWGVDKRFVNNDSFMPKKSVREIQPTAVDKYLLQDTNPDYRVLNLAANTFNESRTSYFHKSVGGYSPVKLRRYQDIIDYHLDKQITPQVLNMLNTRYVIVNTEQGARPIPNDEAMGNAWFVDEISWQNSPDEEINALYTFDPQTTALMDVEWKDKITDEEALTGEDPEAGIELTDYANPGKLIYKSHSERNRLALFSEVFYKTWNVFIDGKPAPLLRANYILRAVEVSAGEHTIEFECVDDVYLSAHKWSLALSILVGLVIISLLSLGCYNIYHRNRNIKKV